MAVHIVNGGGADEQFHDGENGRFAYQITESGTLVILRQDPHEGIWAVRWEIAPLSWQRVEGTKFHGDPEGLAGADGAAHQHDH